MGRNVKIRISFQADIAFLTRLSRAVELDTTIPKERKKKLIGAIAGVQFALMEIERDRLNGK